MPRVIDAANIVNSRESAPDKLRAELGLYMNSDYEAQEYKSGKINLSYITPSTEDNNQLLIPSRKQTIFLSGADSRFRDHSQWESFLLETIETGDNILDHTTDAPSFEVTNAFTKNYHHPDYEDFTKVLPSNQLINYNLFAYQLKEQVETLKNIADIRTPFDRSPPSLESILNQIGNRLDNYVGPVQEIESKQRNIFILTPLINTTLLQDFPYFYEKQILGSTRETRSGWPNFLRQHRKDKNLFQAIHRDLSSSSRDFLVGNSRSRVKIYDIISLMTSTSNINFAENFNESFLLGPSDLSSSSASDRFVNQINLLLSLKKMREYVKRNRKIQDIFDLETCKSFVLGYKIEKYLDNDATGPIQTYYSISKKFRDTQLKYGREYKYKTKVLLGVLGSSYSYSNLVYTSSESELINESREVINSHPTSISSVSDEKYHAYVDVVVKPSFKVLEYEIEPEENYLSSVAFIDSPPTSPHVDVHGCSTKPLVNFRLTPRFFSFVESGQTQFINQDPLTKVGTLRNSDLEIANLFEISGEKTINTDYFSGIYEIYRMEKPPSDKSQFSNYYLATVNSNQQIWLPHDQTPVLENDMNAIFSDKIVPNTKYYYAFRSLTYHGTPSELSDIFEVELLKDSDEYKINMKLYEIPDEKNHTYKKPIKRIIRLVPNNDRLAFNNNSSTSIYDTNVGEPGTPEEANRLVDFASPDTSRVFKMRMTSKHTGKKIDINIRVRLTKSGFEV